ncbi:MULTISPECIES: pyruvate kinase [unclassified Spirosoma]|uniref:pyruvate kinase n=1 Tax=unclassified Spirosoma TaxID=2621999 RepID=UPI000963A42F|nr:MULTISPECIES: pyruvate kinase [unclassified Spirosoma]MBN8826804.1 pyruvate kinase [Spirosoma sp.]OJW73624.1 MAG: pyruvate kinase [Spirosoma sp. 48-14]
MSKKTKIVATIGPASETKEQLLALAKAGVNVFRLNFSHGTHEDHLMRLNRIREINQEYNLNLCVLQDLQGPKIRIGNVENKDGVIIVPGQELVFTNDDIMGTAERVSTPYKDMYKDVHPGERILMDDGKLEVRVLRTEGTDVVTEVVYGGPMKSKKGVNLPNTKVSMPAVTDKDWADLKFGLEHEVEWIALSFVREASEILEIKEYIKSQGKKCRVIAKIEKPEAIQNIDSIVAATDGLMVARGDLGVELPAEEVPMIQKMLVEKCNKAAKPVIVATQMLESMIDAPRPTRAEINDIANSVLDGADAVMLSAETASGKYPILAVESMANTIRQVEATTDKIYYRYHAHVNEEPTDNVLNDNVVMSACRLARDTKAKAIIGITNSGYTAVRISHHRPKADLYVFSNDAQLRNTLGLYWGVQVMPYEPDLDLTVDQTVEGIKQTLIGQGKLQSGDIFINTLSMPLTQSRRTNTVKLSMVD